MAIQTKGGGDAMKEWSVEFDIAHSLRTDGKLDALVVDLLEALTRYSAVAAHDAVLLSVRMSVDAAGVDTAISRARGALLAALNKVGYPGSPEIARIQIETAEELERRLLEPNAPELAGVAEVSKILKISKQRVSELLKKHRLPRPIAILEASPVWRSATVRRYAEDRNPKPGRPAKLTTHYAEKPGR